MVGTTLDISVRKLAEHRLARLAEIAEVAQRAAHAVTYEFYPSTGVALHSAEPLKALTGYDLTPKTETAEWWRSIIHPDDVESAWQEIERGVEIGRGFKLDYRIRHASGHYVWIHDYATVINGQDGLPTRVVGVVLDITKRKSVKRMNIFSCVKLIIAQRTCLVLFTLSHAKQLR